MFFKTLSIRARPLINSVKFQSRHISKSNANDTGIKIATLPCSLNYQLTFIVHSYFINEKSAVY